jgi:hypothetical protein
MQVGVWDSVAQSLTFFTCRYCDFSDSTPIIKFRALVYFDIAFSKLSPWWIMASNAPRYLSIRGCNATGDFINLFKVQSLTDISENGYSTVLIENGASNNLSLEMNSMRKACSVSITSGVITQVRAVNTLGVTFTISASAIHNIIMDRSVVVPSFITSSLVRVANLSLVECQLSVVPIFPMRPFVTDNIDLSNNRFTNLSDADSGLLRDIKRIVLTGNKFTNAVFDLWSSLGNVESLDLSRNSVGLGEVVFTSAQPPKLTFLNLSSNIFNNGISFATAVSSLAHFQCTNCTMRQQSYQGLDKWTNLSVLDISCSTIFVVTANTNMLLPSNLKTLNMSFVSQNPIPANSIASSSLVSVLCKQCGLSGTLPDNLTLLWPAATILDLSNNKLSGRLPKILPTPLLSLDLSNNDFDGWIFPSLLGHGASVNIRGNPRLLCSGSSLTHDTCQLLRLTKSDLRINDVTKQVIANLSSEYLQQDFPLNCYFFNVNITTLGIISAVGSLTCNIPTNVLPTTATLALVLPFDGGRIVSQNVTLQYSLVSSAVLYVR